MKETGPQSDIDSCTTHAEAARWLLSCALVRFTGQEGGHIRHWLRSHHFQQGIDYLEAELNFLYRPRRDDGGPSSLIEIEVARGLMRRIALGLKPLSGV